MQPVRRRNPFGITKAVDLNNEQIEQLWVEMVIDDSRIKPEFDHPASPMPTYILGAKGSGKTHLMRHQSFELQKLRHIAAGKTIPDGLRDDGYLGLYVRCSGLHSNRFSGKQQTEEVWIQLFSFYFELWLAQHALRLLCEVLGDESEQVNREITFDIIELLDKKPVGEIKSLPVLSSYFSEQQKKLDYEINNCLITGVLSPDIIMTPGNVIFGIPKIVEGKIPFLRNVLFVYAIDEFENLTAAQQVHVNTIYREREPPSTFRIGARTYGIHTYRTNSAGEENIKDSEFTEIQLDSKLRELEAHYNSFCRSLVSKRLNQLGGSESGQLEQYFANFDAGWRSADWLNVVEPKSIDRPHFKSLEQLVARHLAEVSFPDVFLAFSQSDSPILEKLNILFFMQEWAKGRDLKAAVARISSEMNAFLNGDKAGDRYKQALGHYSGDLSAQLLRDARRPQYYGGIDNFIRMSAGIPRALLTILRSVFEWSSFADEHPFEGGLISLRSQQKGVLDASDWYFSNMRKAGPDGVVIQAAVERLANIFRINRFADKPVEISLCSFSVSEREVSEEARRVLGLAEARAFVHRIPGGQKERNSEDVTAKFQLSPMLAPRWDLPLSRRGVVTFSADQFNAIFDASRDDEYQLLLSEWRSKVNAPFRRAPKPPGAQIGLFDD
ncbi:ORC-CDC6 family AAA ATPase [Mesorhizobium abyssinicae]|uniref:ORC-CDC6 family AAA ATPase n=1 Tax=Mesorhizobium abyssinicae TaxID=1209958 RepID=UPI00339437D8